MSNVQFKYNRNIFRKDTTPIVSSAVKHGGLVAGVADEYGRQYVVAVDNESREFSERVLIGSTVAVDRVFIGRRILLDQIYGFNTHTSLLYVQLWQTNPVYANWPTLPDWPNALHTLLSVFPVQPDNGVFSVDIGMPFRKGISIAISSTMSTFTSAGNRLVFSAFGRMREGDTPNTDNVASS